MVTLKNVNVRNNKIFFCVVGVSPAMTSKLKDGEELMRKNVFGLGLVKALYTQVTLSTGTI